MSSRVTRSTTRRAADTSQTASQSQANPNPPSPPKTRKRKAPSSFDPGPDDVLSIEDSITASGRLTKKAKTTHSATQAPASSKSQKRAARPLPSMAKPGFAASTSRHRNQLTSSRPSSGDKDNEKAPPNAPEPSRRKGSRGKKTGQGRIRFQAQCLS